MPPAQMMIKHREQSHISPSVKQMDSMAPYSFPTEKEQQQCFENKEETGHQIEIIY